MKTFNYKNISIFKNEFAIDVRYYARTPNGVLKSNSLQGIKKLISQTILAS